MHTKFEWYRDDSMKILDPQEMLSHLLILTVEMPGHDHFNVNIVK